MQDWPQYGPCKTLLFESLWGYGTLLQMEILRNKTLTTSCIDHVYWKLTIHDTFCDMLNDMGGSDMFFLLNPHKSNVSYDTWYDTYNTLHNTHDTCL